jgi:hypothetical protein
VTAAEVRVGVRGELFVEVDEHRAGKVALVVGVAAGAPVEVGTHVGEYGAAESRDVNHRIDHASELNRRRPAATERVRKALRTLTRPARAAAAFAQIQTTVARRSRGGGRVD